MRTWIAAPIFAAMLILAGCGAGGGGDSGKEQEGAVATLLDFTGTTLDGETFEGTSLAGKPAVLWFWAPWCPTCRAQPPQVSELAQKYDGQVAVVGVGGLDGKAAIEEMADDIPHVTHLVDLGGAV